jgi:hypothetical protein
MATAAQITANQQNAMRSTGPLTEAGKQISSRNSLSHGLTAKKLLLAVEDQAEFDELHENLLEAFVPKTKYENFLFEDMVRAYWFWSRAQAAHAAFLDTIVRQELKIEPRLTPKHALARVFTEEKYAKRLRLLMRYETAAERTYRKSEQQLRSEIAARVRWEAEQRTAARLAAQRAANREEPVEPIGSVSYSAPQAAATPQRC